MILYILDIKDIKKQKIYYIIAILSCIIFSSIYEYFSHGVISYYMIFAFIIPLVLGVCSLIILKIKKMPSIIENKLYNCGIVTLTVGSIIQGVLEIYGTTNMKVYIYLVIGICLILTSVLIYIIRICNNYKNVL